MQCRNCGNTIIENKMVCSLCNEPICIVPEYSIEDDVMNKEVWTSSDDQVDRTTRYEHKTAKSRNEELEFRNKTRRYNRRILKYKRRARMIGVNILLLAVACLLIYMYMNSYTGLIYRGEQKSAIGDSVSAEKYFLRAINKKSNKVLAYQKITELYVSKGEVDKAEHLLLDGVKVNNENVELYISLIHFYIDIEQHVKVMPFLEKHSAYSVINELDEYIVLAPSFSLDGGVYDNVREVSLESNEEKILYAINSMDSEEYIEYNKPIQISEGVVSVTAIATNELGITSIPVTYEYMIELPIEGAPAVSPSTGQYSDDTKIIVQVPTGYTAYYTLDGMEPSEKSLVYDEFIEMPIGNTVISVVLIDGNGRKSEITKRNYELVVN